MGLNDVIENEFHYLQNMPMGICLTRTDYTVVYWNRKLEDWTGKNLEEVKGEKLTNLYPHLRDSAYFSNIEKVADGKASAIFSRNKDPYFLPLYLPSGAKRVQHTTINLIHMSNGCKKQEPVIMFCIQDVTEHGIHSTRNQQNQRDDKLKVRKREEVEEALKHSEEQNRLFFQNLSIGIFHFDNNGYLTNCNQAFIDIIGTSWEQIQNLYLFDLPNQEVIGAIKDALKGLTTYYNGPYTAKTSGRELYLKAQFAPIKLNDGTIQGGIGLVENITNRVKAEQQLKESKEMLDSINRNIEEGIFRYRPGEGIVYANNALARMYDYPNAESFKRNAAEDFLSAIDLNKLTSITYKHGSFGNQEVTFRRNSGEQFWGLMSLTYIRNRKGEIEYYDGAITDITKRKEAELEQEALYRVAHKTTDIRDTIAYYRDIHGIICELMDSENMFIAELDSELKEITFPYFRDQCRESPESKSFGNGLLEYLISGNEPIRLDGKQIQKMIEQGDIKEANTACSNWLGVPISNSNQKFGALVVQNYEKKANYTKRDEEKLTFIAQHLATAMERNRYESNIINAKLEAEKANRSKSVFLANMSHELRTPLNSIIGFTRRARRRITESKDSGVDTLLQKVVRNAENLLQIINDILDFSKIEAGKIEYDIKQVNVNEICEQVIEELEPLASQKDLSYRLEADEIHYVESDPVKLKQVIQNLYSNAIKFTDSGEVWIEIDEKIENNKEYHCISIKDTGIGIPYNKTHSIFNIFEQAQNADHDGRGGTGLGLSISRRFIDEMGGFLRVESEEGVGSNFNILFSKNDNKNNT